MNIKKLSEGILGSNCYILYGKKECIVIDPGVRTEVIFNVTKENGLSVKAVIITHAHYDHVVYLDELREKTKAPLYTSLEESEALTDPFSNASVLFGSGKVFQKADRLLKDGDVIELEDESLEILHTPGHTDGSICVKGQGFVITGDTLFYMSIGRTDLGRGDYEAILRSIKTKLYSLPEDTVVYPGHGANSTIGREKAGNPFTY
jgi:hydroxyacylglutathione hydrolase